MYSRDNKLEILRVTTFLGHAVLTAPIFPGYRILSGYEVQLIQYPEKIKFG